MQKDTHLSFSISEKDGPRMSILGSRKDLVFNWTAITSQVCKELGIPPETMRIVVLRDTIRNLAHAVLVVYMNDNAYVLDNLSNAVLSHTRFKHYSPQ